MRLKLSTVNPWNVSLTTSPLFAFAPYRVEAQSTIDSLTDSSELLTVNQKYEASFHVSDGEVKQAGPLNPGEVIGGKIAHLVAQHLDATFFAEVLNADNDFDTGDLTTLVSVAFHSRNPPRTLPIMVSRMPAKLRRNNQTLNNLCFANGLYGASSLVQYLLGKDIDLAGSVFKNGYAGTVASAEVYVSENLTGTAVLGLATQPTDGDTIVINGVTFTFKTTLGATAGNVLIGADADAARLNLDPHQRSWYDHGARCGSLAADQLKLTDTYRIAAVNDTAANTMTITGTGSGALTLRDLHGCYGCLGKTVFTHTSARKVQSIWLCKTCRRSTCAQRQTAVERTSSLPYLAGIKTFADGSKQFLNVLLAR